jgi:hypothetical protein
MSEPHIIPAASIAGVDLSRIAQISAEAANEIERIGNLLGQGADTTPEFISLCKLLNQYGESRKSETLLRCNFFQEGDEIYRVYRELFGFSADTAFESSLRDFATQFGVRLEAVKNLGFLRRQYTTFPTTIPSDVDPAISRFLVTSCQVEFRYDSDGIGADIVSNAVDFPSEEYLLLQFGDGRWCKTR